MANKILESAFLLAAFIACFSAAVFADAPKVAVLYPDLRDPFRTIFQEIIGGIEYGLKTPVKSYFLQEGEEAALKSQLTQDRMQIAVILGRAGMSTARSLLDAVPVVMGATFLTPEEENPALGGITLAPDPEIVFEKLKNLVPSVKRISVIYEPKHKGWEIERARVAAKERGLTLNALPAEDLRNAALLYRDVLRETKDGSSAIWLLQDNPALDEHALLPMILKEAWDNNLILFSSNPDHVRKGALFSLYPDNTGLGRSLAVVVRGRLQAGMAKPAAIEPLRDLLLAVNVRTAEHLGLHFDVQDRRLFDLVFPPP